MVQWKMGPWNTTLGWKGRPSFKKNNKHGPSSHCSINMDEFVSRWCLNQPIWKICRSQNRNLPQFSAWKCSVEASSVGFWIKNVWNHHLDFFIFVHSNHVSRNTVCSRKPLMLPCWARQETTSAASACRAIMLHLEAKGLIHVHPGRLMAGTYKNYPFFKGNWSEPNLQGIAFHVNLQGCTLISYGIHVYLDTYIYHKNHPYPLEIYIPVPWIENVIGKTIGDTFGMGAP